MTQRRYFCDNDECNVDIFTERTEFVSPYYQFTERCREYMLKVASLVSSEAASKILGYQGIKVSGDTLLNMLKASGKAIQGKIVRKIGVDDWAYRKGHEYGTIICDLETHEIIDILEGRDKETFEKWLKGRPEIEIVSRDRASAYASAVNSVLPEAVQIADRFHITKNLLEALDNTMKTFMPETIAVPCDERDEPIATETNQMVKKTQI
jgi:transposase